VRGTCTVDSLAESEARLRASGATILQPPTPMVVRNVEGDRAAFQKASLACLVALLQEILDLPHLAEVVARMPPLRARIGLQAVSQPYRRTNARVLVGCYTGALNRSSR
jgi:hypothetical protein